jgi:hypothetical protein
VTHQGFRPGVASAPLVAWTHDSATVAPADTATDITAQGTPQELAIATLPTVAACWACRRCGEHQPTALRLGFVRYGVPARRRHDHSP